MGMIFGICAVMVLATFAPEIFEKLTGLFKFMIHKLKSLWNMPS